MPSVQSGARLGPDLLNDAVVIDMMARVAQLEPESQPLTGLLNLQEKSMSCRNPDPQHMEDELLPNRDLVNGAQTAADVSIEIDNPLFYLVGDILHVPRTGENMRVTAAPGTSPITVVRGVGSAPANILDDEPLWILGGAQVENANSRVALNTLEIQKQFHCQIVRNSIEEGEISMATERYGGDFDDQFDKKLIEHKRSLDGFFKYGTPSRVDSGSGFIRTMEGVLSWIQTNRMAVDGVLGEGEFDAFLEMGFQYGSSTKVLLASQRLVRSINNFAKNRMETVNLEGSYGMDISEYRGPSGRVWIMSDRELKGAVYSGYGILLDPEYLLIRYLLAGGSGTTDKYAGSQYCRRVTHIQASDLAGRKDEIYSCLCLQMVHERTSAVLSGVEG
jgi:hypothetical protein